VELALHKSFLPDLEFIWLDAKSRPLREMNPALKGQQAWPGKHNSQSGKFPANDPIFNYFI
jgi:hypothetical protein